MDAQQKWKATLGRDVLRPFYIRQACEGAPIIIPFIGLSKRQASLLQAALNEVLGDRLAHFAVVDGKAYVHLQPYTVRLDLALSLVQTLVQPMRLGVFVTLYKDARDTREGRWEIKPVTTQLSDRPHWINEVTQWHNSLKFDGLQLRHSGRDRVVGSVVHVTFAMSRAEEIVELFCNQFAYFPVRTLQITAPM